MEHDKNNRTFLDRLHIFDVVMKRRSMTEAAISLNMTPSRVSMAMKKLRELYSDPLFIRKKNVLEPTEFARILHREIQQNLQKSNITNELQIIDSDQNQLLISCSPHIATNVIPLAFQLIQELPLISMKHIDLPMSRKDHTKFLIDNAVDIIFDYTPVDHPDIFFRRLFKEEYCIVCYNNHPRLSHSITLKEYAQETHAVLETPSSHERKSDYSQHIHNEDKIIGFCSHYYLDLLAVVEVSDMICTLPQNIYLKLRASFNVKSLNYNFNLGFKKPSLYMSYLKELKKSKYKSILLKKMEKMR
jgi:DNA-binding transcriptional LysR family regulator